MLLTKSTTFIIGPIAEIIGYIMNGIFFILGKIGLPNIGLSIIFMTILIYMAMLPLTIRQQKFSKLQRKMQPELNKIQKKYQGRKDSQSVAAQQEEMKQVYDTVLKAQLAGIAAGRAGIPGSEIDGAARAVITEAGFGDYFGHGFGHCLGLDIHEPPFANPRGQALMPENSVCSAEPGIYIPGRFGVRIEDVMILRAGGSEVITRAPKTELLLVGR